MRDEHAATARFAHFRGNHERSKTRSCFAANGGMFDEDGQPIGYYVEEGQRLTVLNQNDGPGNFHLMPNGVFFGDADWRVARSCNRALCRRGRKPSPISPPNRARCWSSTENFTRPSIRTANSRKIRNAVGVDATGRAHFVISEAPISFGKLARYYRDVLNVDNALFLDGSVSQIWDVPNERLDTGPDIGPLIVVRNRAEAGGMSHILVIDNYDSFTFNLVHYLMELGAEVQVVRNDAITADEAMRIGRGGCPDFARSMHSERSGHHP